MLFMSNREMKKKYLLTSLRTILNRTCRFLRTLKQWKDRKKISGYPVIQFIYFVYADVFGTVQSQAGSGNSKFVSFEGNLLQFPTNKSKALNCYYNLLKSLK